MEALQAATLHGGAIMKRPGELGQLKEGFLADLLLVDGDPLADLSILGDRKKLLAIMKDGAFHKEPEMRQIGKWMDEAIQKAADDAALAKIAAEVRETCRKFPAPGLATD